MLRSPAFNRRAQLLQDLPIFLAVRGGSTLATGTQLGYQTDTPLTNLHVERLNRLGSRVERFADRTGELAGLSDSAYAGLLG